MATATKKTTAKKTVARKPRARKTAKPMTEHQRTFAASVVAHATEEALASEHLGVKRQSSSELNGSRQGMVSRILLDDGSRIVVTVVVR